MLVLLSRQDACTLCEDCITVFTIQSLFFEHIFAIFICIVCWQLDAGANHKEVGAHVDHDADSSTSSSSKPIQFTRARVRRLLELYRQRRHQHAVALASHDRHHHQHKHADKSNRNENDGDEDEDDSDDEANESRSCVPRCCRRWFVLRRDIFNI